MPRKPVPPKRNDPIEPPAAGGEPKPPAPTLRSWPADTVERWELGRILPYPRNARLHTEEQVAQIAASMIRFGVTAPVLVDEHGVLIYGHGRLRAAQMLAVGGFAEGKDGAPAPPRPEFAELPVTVAAGWSEDEKRAYRLADNQIALNSDWDLPVLRAEVKTLNAAGFNMPLLGFPEAKLVSFMAQPGAPGQFQSFGENIPTDHCCPSCGYKWSGRPDAGAQREGGDGAAAGATPPAGKG